MSEAQDFSVSRDLDGRVILRMEPFVAERLVELLREWNERLIADGMNRDSGWAEVADKIGEVVEAFR